MTQLAIKLTARVQAGHRVEFTAPELTEGEEVELIVLKSDGSVATAAHRESALEYLHSTPRVPRPADYYGKEEEVFREGRELREAARLRALLLGLKTPDAIHAATAIVHGRASFITDDTDVRRVPNLPLAILVDILAPA